MQALKLQLNTPTEFNRDLEVDLVNQTTGEKRKAKPYLDGTVSVMGLDPGPWRVRIKHPNHVFDLYDRNIRVLRDRPTFTPVRIPSSAFVDTPIRDVPEADLSAVQQRFDEAGAESERQANKLGGQPIYADDWNALATTMAGVARAGRELTDVVSPNGHDHPELVEKLDELQAGIERLFDSFGSAIAQLQRQIQQLSLRRKVDTALDQIADLEPAVRTELIGAVDDLALAWQDQPAIYGRKRSRTAGELHDRLAEILVDQDDAVANNEQVVEMIEFTRAMSRERAPRSFEQEIAQQQKTGSRSVTGTFYDALQAGGR